MDIINSGLKTPYCADDNLSKRAVAALDTMHITVLLYDYDYDEVKQSKSSVI